MDVLKTIHKVAEGTRWVVVLGDLRGPSTTRIPAWCKPWEGPEGVWQPCGAMPSGKIIWRCLIFPYRQPSGVEELAELGAEVGAEVGAEQGDSGADTR